MNDQRGRTSLVRAAAGAVAAPGEGRTQAARRQLMREVTEEIPRPPAGEDRAARREALLHVLEMSRRRRRSSRP